MVEVDPFTIRFTQASIGRTFKDGTTLADAIAELAAGTLTADDFPPIRIFEREGRVYTLDNRRLLVFQEAGRPIRTIPASGAEIAAEAFKFTTQNGGESVIVRGGL